MKYYKHTTGNIWQVNGELERRIYMHAIVSNFTMAWRPRLNGYQSVLYTEITEEEAFLAML